MSENTIDSENISKPAPDTAKPKVARRAGRKAANNGSSRSRRIPEEAGTRLSLASSSP